ncbi:uncharacterized protein J3R85_000382 [Psidium guajava]|nr:uncharacterized protein J3R85_000382 [Psidium guajava]
MMDHKAFNISRNYETGGPKSYASLYSEACIGNTRNVLVSFMFVCPTSIIVILRLNGSFSVFHKQQ